MPNPVQSSNGTIILPVRTAANPNAGWQLGTETETINDTAEHPSVDVLCESLQEKIVYITAAEVVVAGVPGPLWCWIELSPYDSDTSTAFWAAIGGGGGAIAPTSPHIEIATGVNGTIHGIILPWTIHSPYARLVIQTPASVATAVWAVQAIFGGKS